MFAQLPRFCNSPRRKYGILKLVVLSIHRRRSRSFYSPWFGMDPDDNLNLLQPVNPFTGDGWQM